MVPTVDLFSLLLLPLVFDYFFLEEKYHWSVLCLQRHYSYKTKFFWKISAIIFHKKSLRSMSESHAVSEKCAYKQIWFSIKL